MPASTDRTRIVARTARQLLRPLGEADAEGVLALNADPDVLRFTGDPPFESLEQARSFLASYDPYAREGMGRWAAVDVASGAFLGWCGLRRQEDGEVDLGYRYLPSARGRGLATEAAIACLDLAFRELSLTSVIARSHPGNAPSLRVIEKLGFVREGPCRIGDLPGLQHRMTASAWRRR